MLRLRDNSRRSVVGIGEDRTDGESAERPGPQSRRHQGHLGRLCWQRYASRTDSGLRGWATHVQKAASGFAITETPLADCELQPYEAGALGPICGILLQLGSGYGSCTCTPEDHDF